MASKTNHTTPQLITPAIARHTHTIHNVEKWFLLLALAALLASCDGTEGRESRANLAHASRVMEDSAAKAQSLIRQVRTELLTEYDYQYFRLLQARVAGMLGINVSMLEARVGDAKDYFARKNDTTKLAFAYFVLAKVYEAQEYDAKALLNYLLADHWATKADYQIPDFLYSAIPYNIASRYYRDGKYEESLAHLNKALKHIEKEPCTYKRKLYAWELKAQNYRMLAEVDSSLYYFDQALALANQNDDTLSTDRILYNKYALFTDSYSQLEQACSRLLPQLNKNNDSFHMGLIHLAVAKLCANTNRVDSALVSIHIAEQLLSGSESHIRLTLYEQLYQIEQQKGNHAEADSYKQQYEKYKVWLESKRVEEQAEEKMLKRSQLQ